MECFDLDSVGWEEAELGGGTQDWAVVMVDEAELVVLVVLVGDEVQAAAR